MFPSARGPVYLVLSASLGSSLAITEPANAQVWFPLPKPMPEVMDLMPNTGIQTKSPTRPQSTLFSSINSEHSKAVGHLDFVTVEPVLRESLSALSQNGETSMDVAVVLNNLAWLYQQQQQFSKAEPLYLRSLKVFQANAESALFTAIVQYNLADMYVSRNTSLSALGLYRKALGSLERIWGTAHPATQIVRKKYDAIRVRFISPDYTVANVDQ
jgi:tetratricopeptide (TPR) repeat protein